MTCRAISVLSAYDHALVDHVNSPKNDTSLKWYSEIPTRGIAVNYIATNDTTLNTCVIFLSTILVL